MPLLHRTPSGRLQLKKYDITVGHVVHLGPRPSDHAYLVAKPPVKVGMNPDVELR
jgi:hypothetical protein